jgi:hypothetical protein
MTVSSLTFLLDEEGLAKDKPIDCFLFTYLYVSIRLSRLKDGWQ